MLRKYCGLLLSLAVSRVVAEDPLVNIEHSKVSYQGFSQDHIEHFQNIRYAHDTSEARRFAPPEPYIPAEGSTIDATTFGPACPQSRDAVPPAFAEVTHEISEDCLNLRIARPSGTDAESKLPVVVYIHGGGVVKGHAYDSHFDPDRLLKLSVENGKPIIYVAINYRLSIFGFARLPVLKEQKSLNVGMRDQRAALQWVKDNIAAFGGDSEKITAYGLSAGGTFASLHTTTYAGEQGVPFNQAWIMSGPPGTALNITSDATTLHTLAVAEKLQCRISDGEETLKCLREASWEQLLGSATEYAVANHPPLGLFTFIPSVDEDFIPERQSILYKSGRLVTGIPTVLMWAQDDGATNVPPAQLVNNEEDMAAPIRSFAHALTDNDLSSLYLHYPVADFEQDVHNYEARKTDSDPSVSVHWFRVSRIMRDILFTCSSINFGREMYRHSIKTDGEYAGVRLYAFNQSMFTPLFHGAGMPYVGTTHGSDMNYIFNGVFPEGVVSEDDANLSKELSTAFINFAYSGDPNGDVQEGEGYWPEAFGADSLEESFNVQVIGGPYGTGPAKVTAQEFDGKVTSAQVEMDGNFEFGAMQSKAAQVRKAELEREKLLERCKFIDSLSAKLGV